MPAAQNAFSGLTWTNLTDNANGKIAGFVDFDWGATLCKNNRCTTSQVGGWVGGWVGAAGAAGRPPPLLPGQPLQVPLRHKGGSLAARQAASQQMPGHNPPLPNSHRPPAAQVSDTTILATMYKKAGDWDMAWDPDISFVTSADFFRSFSTGGL